MREQGMKLEALAGDTVQQRPGYEPGKNNMRRFSCWVLVRLRTPLRLRQLPHFCSQAVKSPVLP